MQSQYRRRIQAAAILVFLKLIATSLAQVSADDAEANAYCWGKSTNGVKVGICVLTNQYNPYGVLVPALRSDTNGGATILIDLPPTESLYRMALWDANGTIVPMTAKGESLGQPVRKPFKLTMGMNVQAGYSSVGVGRSVSVLSTHAFTPFDFFSITNPGSYRLKYQLVIIRSAGMTNNVGPGIPPTLSLPPVEVEFEVKKEEGDKWAIAPMKVKGAELQEK